MARRRSLLSTVLKTAESIGAAARRAAREHERALRRERTATEREARALARMAKAEERELALAAASEEHAENEALLVSIREVLKHAPAKIRSARDYEPLLAAAPFPPPGRSETDRVRFDREAADRLAAVRVPKPIGLLALTAAGVVLALGGVALSFYKLAPGIVCLGAGVIAAIASSWKASLVQQASARAEEARIREEIASRIAADLERDRAAHEESEKLRIARMRALLAGEERACVEAFQAAVDRLELPLDASAVVGMASSDTAEVQVNLHAVEEIPVQRSTLLKTGRITYRNRPKRDVQEDDAWALASLCLLYAAAAFDALPPVETIVLSAFRPGVDPATGQDSELCYASLVVDREDFVRLKLDRLDPIAALRSLEARFSCTATCVLKPVEPFAFEDLGAAGGDLSLARQALALAMACARADSAFEPAEAEAVTALLAERFPLSAPDAKRLSSWRASLAEAPPRIEEPARLLREALPSRDRQLLVERLAQVITADGSVHEKEAALLRSVAAALDLAPTVVDGLVERHAPRSAGGPRAEDSAHERPRLLAALDLPRDSVPDRLAVERSLRRMEDVYAEEKFALVAPELRDMARKRLVAAREAAEKLLLELPAPPQPPTQERSAGVRRENADLDSIFGA